MPLICKKSKRTKFKRGHVKLCLHDIMIECNLLTLEERRDLFLLKHAYCYIFDPKKESRQGRSWPLLPVSVCNTKFAQNSINYRAIKIWNTLPRSWSKDGLSYSKFVEMCKDMLVAKRDNYYVYI